MASSGFKISRYKCILINTFEFAPQQTLLPLLSSNKAIRFRDLNQNLGSLSIMNKKVYTGVFRIQTNNVLRGMEFGNGAIIPPCLINPVIIINLLFLYLINQWNKTQLAFHVIVKKDIRPLTPKPPADWWIIAENLDGLTNCLALIKHRQNSLLSSWTKKLMKSILCYN